jgi:methionyl aminopeptidase
MHDKLDSMRYGGKVNVAAIEWGFHIAKPGATLREVDEAIEWYIRSAGCEPAFKGYQPEGFLSPFPGTACISPNEVVVHGVPGDYVLQPGDLLTIDVGTKYQGFFVDAARTRLVPGGRNTEKAQHLIDATEAILQAQLKVIKNDCDLILLVQAAEEEAAKWGVNIMPQWGGHGIGPEIHMDPFIPNAIDRTQSKLKQELEERQYSRRFLVEGQTICIEPVTSYGDHAIIVDEDGWTVRQAQRKLAAHTERCLLVTNDGYELLS